MSSQKQFPKPPIGTLCAGFVQNRLCYLRGGKPISRSIGTSGVGASTGWTEFHGLATKANQDG